MEPQPTGLSPKDTGTRKDGISLTSPDAPLKLYQKLRENARKGPKMSVGSFLTDLTDLDSTGAIDQLPALKDKILEVGQDPLLWLEVYTRTRDSVQSQSQQDIQKNLRLAHLLGMDQPSDDPRRQKAVNQINQWTEEYGGKLLEAEREELIFALREAYQPKDGETYEERETREKRFWGIKDKLESLLHLPEEERTKVVEEEAQKAEEARKRYASMNEWLFKYSLDDELADRLFAQTSPELDASFLIFSQKTKQAVVDIPNLRSQREGLFDEMEAKDNFIKTFYTSTDTDTGYVLSDLFENLKVADERLASAIQNMQTDDRSSIEDSINDFRHSLSDINRSNVTYSRTFTAACQKPVDFLNAAADRAGLEFIQDDRGYIRLAEKQTRSATVEPSTPKPRNPFAWLKRK